MDWSKLKYKVEVRSGSSVKTRVNYRVLSTDSCWGAELASSGGYSFCQFESSRSQFTFSSSALSSSTGVSGAVVTLTTLEDKPATIRVSSSVDLDGNGKIGPYEPYSSEVQVRIFDTRIIPNLYDYQFDAPVFGEYFSASIGTKGSSDPYLYSTPLIDLNDVFLEKREGEDPRDLPFFASNGLRSSVGYLSTPQAAYFTNQSSARITAGATTALSVGLFDTADAPINTSLNGTYVKAQLELFSNYRNTYGGITGASFAELETNSSGLVSVLLAPDLQNTGMARLVMKYYSADDVVIATSIISLEISNPGSNLTHPKWKRQVFAAGKPEARDGVYELQLVYQPTEQIKAVFAKQVFDYSKYNLGSVAMSVRDIYENQVTPGQIDESIPGSLVHVFDPTADSFEYLLEVKDPNEKPGVGWPVFVEVNLQGLSSGTAVVNGQNFTLKEEVTLSTESDELGQVKIQIFVDNNARVSLGSDEAVTIEPQVFGVRDNQLPRVSRSATIIQWKNPTTAYLQSKVATASSTAGSLTLEAETYSLNRQSNSSNLVFSAEHPLSLVAGSLSSKQAVVKLKDLQSGQGTSRVFASMVSSGKFLQISWLVSWNADTQELSAIAEPHTNGVPLLSRTALFESTSLRLSVFETEKPNEFIARVEKESRVGSRSFECEMFEVLAILGGTITAPVSNSFDSKSQADVHFSTSDLSGISMSVRTRTLSTDSEWESLVLSPSYTPQSLDGKNVVTISTDGIPEITDTTSLQVELSTNGTAVSPKDVSLTVVRQAGSSSLATLGKVVVDELIGVASMKPVASASNSVKVLVQYDSNDDDDYLDPGDIKQYVDITLFSEPETSGEAKVNAGSFKGYVAVYAKGYEGHRLSAKVGNDWVIVDSLATNFERVVEFTGAGEAIAVRIYIDRVLVDTINLTTR